MTTERLPLAPPFDSLANAPCCHHEQLLAIYEDENYAILGDVESRLAKAERDLEWQRRLVRDMAAWQALAQRVLTDWEPRRHGRMADSPAAPGSASPVK